MAATVRAYTKENPAHNCIIVTWEGLDGDDTGRPVRLPWESDKTVQLGAGGGNTHGGSTTILQGSNDVRADPDHADHSNAVWFTLTDPQGNAISRTTSALLEQVQENCLWYRPSQSGGTAGDIDVIIVAKGGM